MGLPESIENSCGDSLKEGLKEVMSGERKIQKESSSDQEY